jgi:hypothetical protein
MFALSDKNMKLLAIVLGVVAVCVAACMNKKVLGNNCNVVCGVSVVVGLVALLYVNNQEEAAQEPFYFEEATDAANNAAAAAANNAAAAAAADAAAADNAAANNAVEDPKGPSGNNALAVNEGAVPETAEDPKKYGCLPGATLNADELLPNANSDNIFDTPANPGNISGANFLDAGYHVGVNTVGQSLRNANRQIRSEPPNPQVKVSPWLQSTIEPDTNRKPLEIGA